MLSVFCSETRPVSGMPDAVAQVILQRFVENFLTFDNKVELWISRDVGEAVRVWISTLTELEAEPVLERLLFARRHDMLLDIIDQLLLHTTFLNQYDHFCGKEYLYQLLRIFQSDCLP